tara:strand:- start:97 stop:204 length:108 start_codon:yes stop_codon:yes gene_type:complete
MTLLIYKLKSALIAELDTLIEEMLVPIASKINSLQ